MVGLRDPLVLTYEALRAAIKVVHGEEFVVFDDLPDVLEFRKKLPAANIGYVSGRIDKALMREFMPHALKKNADGTFNVATETARFEYIIQVSFFAAKKGTAQALSTAFYTEMEEENEIPLSDDSWGETMRIFLETPPPPPRGEPDLYQCDQTWRCTGKLLTTEIVNEVDVKKLKLRVYRGEARTPKAAFTKEMY